MSLKVVLDRLYKGYDFKERLRHDPIEFPHRYSDPLDIEVTGFISSQFAYGKISIFKPFIERMLVSFGKSPYEFMSNFNLKKDSKHLEGTSYRFSSEKDILCLIYMMNTAIKEWGSLRGLFYYNYYENGEEIGRAISGFNRFFLSIKTTPVYRENIKPHGLRHFFPLPEKGSACKRMNLFLRWMVRRRDIDFGIWDRIHPSKLIIPLDTHIARIARCLGLTKRRASDWKTASEITESLRSLDSEDPLKYDFVLCHYGISGQCKGERLRHICSTCILYDINHR